MLNKTKKFIPKKIRQSRVRSKIFGTAERPRLSVFRSNRFIYAALIDDTKAVTLMSVSDMKDSKAKANTTFGKVEKAEAVGKKIAELALAKGVKAVVFDRAGYRYTGRVAGVAKGARDGGLEF